MLFLTCFSGYTCTGAEKCPGAVENKLWYQTCQIWCRKVPSCFPAKGPVVQNALLSPLLLQGLLSKQLTYNTGLTVVSRENSKPEAFPCQDKKWGEKTEGRTRIQPGAEETTTKKQRQTESHRLTLLSASKSRSTHAATQPCSARTRFLQHRNPFSTLRTDFLLEIRSHQPLSIPGLTPGRQQPVGGDTEGTWGGLGVVAAALHLLVVPTSPTPDAAAMCWCEATQVALRLWETENGRKLCLSQGCPIRSVTGFFSSLEKARINTRSKISPCPFSGRNGLPSGEISHQGRGEREEVMQRP